MIKFKEIQSVVNQYIKEYSGDVNNISLKNVALPKNGKRNSVIWLNEKHWKSNKFNETDIKAGLIITDFFIDINTLPEYSVIFQTNNPRLVFSKIVTEFFTEKLKHGIHSSSIIHPEAEISPSAYIGPNCTIGKAEIDSGTQINGNTFIHNDVKIGKNCIIDAGCVIGADGFGHVKDENNQWYKFPHIGGTIIEDNVEVGANTYITKGALKNTHIKKGCKIALSVCIGHNVVLGKNSIVLSNSIIGGSTIVGEDCWISITASIKDNLIIGDKSVIGMGAVITKNVEKGQTMIGNPGKELIKK
jgi:UDP-3-O-[3-hydroxymyristoyl] glucosamine N-acyltransferase